MYTTYTYVLVYFVPFFVRAFNTVGESPTIRALAVSTHAKSRTSHRNRPVTNLRAYTNSPGCTASQFRVYFHLNFKILSYVSFFDLGIVFEAIIFIFSVYFPMDFACAF